MSKVKYTAVSRLWVMDVRRAVEEITEYLHAHVNHDLLRPHELERMTTSYFEQALHRFEYVTVLFNPDNDQPEHINNLLKHAYSAEVEFWEALLPIPNWCVGACALIHRVRNTLYILYVHGDVSQLT